MPFQLHVQPIGTGSAVLEDGDVWAFITPHMRKALGLEMEASALADIVRARAHHDPIDAVVMKGVMDFANSGRDDHFKDYAARASAECLIAFLRDQLVGRAAAADRAGANGGAVVMHFVEPSPTLSPSPTTEPHSARQRPHGSRLVAAWRAGSQSAQD